MRYSQDYPRDFECGLSVTSLGDKDHEVSHIVYITEKAALQHVQNTNFWAIRCSQPFQVDQLVSYPIVFIHLIQITFINQYDFLGPGRIIPMNTIINSTSISKLASHLHAGMFLVCLH